MSFNTFINQVKHSWKDPHHSFAITFFCKCCIFVSQCQQLMETIITHLWLWRYNLPFLGPQTSLPSRSRGLRLRHGARRFGHGKHMLCPAAATTGGPLWRLLGIDAGRSGCLSLFLNFPLGRSLLTLYRGLWRLIVPIVRNSAHTKYFSTYR